MAHGSVPADRQRWTAVVAVAVGGALGTGLRLGLSLWLPPVHGIPFTTAAINVSGAWVLGLLSELLSRQGPDTGRRRSVRLFVGVGVLGGFTTYSALAVDTVLLQQHLGGAVAMAYSAATVVVGVAAAALGVFSGGRLHRRWSR